MFQIMFKVLQVPPILEGDPMSLFKVNELEPLERLPTHLSSFTAGGCMMAIMGASGAGKSTLLDPWGKNQGALGMISEGIL